MNYLIILLRFYESNDTNFQAGGFYSAEDADSFPSQNAAEKKEGAFYVWSEEEIKNALSQNVIEVPGMTYADVFCTHFNVQPKGNVNPAKVRYKL